MEIQDIDDAEKSAGSDIVSRTETTCTWVPKPVMPADIESGITKNSMILAFRNDCSFLHKLLTGCKKCRALACNVWLPILRTAGLLLVAIVNRSRFDRVSRCNHREK